ncbi:MAG: glycosyltransferase family 39 protein, partial [Candidatus Heimdallarchaeota archaeon]|nr:glycosyltransferase family 39 protein [Candidatus Heimdallarchaeota archaeon]
MRDTRDNSSLSTFKSYSKKQVFSRFKAKISSFLELLDLKPIEFVILMIFLAFVFFLYLINLDVQRPYDYDEGVYLLTSQMFRKGFIPYSQLFASQPPLLLELIKLIAPSFKNDLFGSRFSIVLLGVIGLLATALCTNTIIKSYFQKEEKEINLLKRSFPIVLTVLILGIGSHCWFYYSRRVLPNIPEASFTVLAFWFFLKSIKNNKSSIWAFLAGTSLSIGMFFKLFGAIPFPFILIYYIIFKKDKLKTVSFIIGLFLPFLILFNYDV